MQELRPMSVPSILDVTFQLYRERFATFLTIAIVVYVPIALIYAITTPSALGGLAAFSFRPVELSPADAILMMMGSLGALAILVVLLPLCMAAMTHNISAAYLGENLSAADSFKRAFSRLGQLIVTQFIVGIIVVFGVMLCIVPGVIFASWYFVAVPVVVLEGLSTTTAMSRSKELVAGNVGKVALIVILVFLLGFVFALISQVLIAFLPLPMMLKTFAQHLLPAFILPIQTAPPVLIYYDMRIRKEAFDLQMLASALHQLPTA